ncbi:MAG TPA: hypothetical protein VGO34_06660 [Alphaproteobacteria bacterium]|jgi:hypothetical protein
MNPMMQTGESASSTVGVPMQKKNQQRPARAKPKTRNGAKSAHEPLVLHEHISMATGRRKRLLKTMRSQEGMK